MTMLMTLASQIVPLDLLAAGETARVFEVDGRAEFVHRLHEMGLQPGAEIRMLRPGSPCILAVNEQRLSFRLEDSTTVLVEVSR